MKDSCVTSDKPKNESECYNAVGSLYTNNTPKALFAITSPPQRIKYQMIKIFLTSPYGLTEEERATSLLNRREIAVCKSSELMDNILALTGEHKPRLFKVKQLFIQVTRPLSGFSSEFDSLIQLRFSPRI
ncbi:hypothetical protein RRG08_058008 [Elysia crispata]|uniref:Uncharacterized protein n=1 Tax=Elysia crispata TaxID=231223 RepID=A0AAE1E294_9GAST|nr:hypothetical protein RRG08_058008 [Elysia crispata]